MGRVCGFADGKEARAARQGRRVCGFTLVEMVMYIAIVSLAVAGVLSVMTYTTRYSADPMVQQQALLIAESYMEEILLKRFIDPATAPTTSQICPTPEGSRASYDNTCDYHNLNNTAGAVDQLGNTVAGLTAYNVSVSVIGSLNDATALGPTTSQITNSDTLRVLRVDIDVTHDDQPNFSLRMTGYRTNYYCDISETAGSTGCWPR